MIHDPGEAKIVAANMEDPVVVFDPTPNSGQGRFYLLEWMHKGKRPTQLPAAKPFEMSRRCFNDMRDQGMLVTDLDQRRKFHPQCQAWPVVTE